MVDGRLPNFIIAGAMKSGTTYLSSLLKSHSEIFISDPREPFFFDRDDYITQNDFIWECKVAWQEFDWENSKSILLEKYKKLFNIAEKHKLCGEGSTSYMASRKAPRRLAEIVPDVKIIFLLRDPVDRAYSAYWHWVRTGRAIYRFEKQIQLEPLIILQRGLYKKHIERYKNYFTEDQLYFGIFEQFISDTQSEITNICTFLNVSPMINILKTNGRKNQARIPRFYNLQLFLNRLGRLINMKNVNSYLRDKNNKYPEKPLSQIIKYLNSINIHSGRYPPMNISTRRNLEIFYNRENIGLSDLIGIEIKNYWKWFTG